MMTENRQPMSAPARSRETVPHRAPGTKCARSWRFSTEIGRDPDYPDVTPRDAEALREWDAAQAASTAG